MPRATHVAGVATFVVHKWSTDSGAYLGRTVLLSSGWQESVQGQCAALNNVHRLLYAPFKSVETQGRPGAIHRL
jgi:hypothetical protein